MSFIDNLRDALSLENIKRAREFMDSMNSKPESFDARGKFVLNEDEYNYFPGGWTVRGWNLATPQQDDYGQYYSVDSKWTAKEFSDENGNLAMLETPMQTYDFSGMSEEEANRKFRQIFDEILKQNPGKELVPDKLVRNKDKSPKAYNI